MLQVLCQNPDLGDIHRIAMPDDAAVSELACEIMQHAHLSSPPVLFAYLNPQLLDHLKNAAIINQDRVDLPEDMPLTEIISGMRHPDLPIYYTTLDVSSDRLLALRTQRFAEVGYDIPRLQASRVLIGGVGLLGGEIAQNLATLGVGQLEVIDDGTVDWYNLYRQPLFTREDVYLKKTVATKRRLEAMGGVQVTASTLTVPSWRDDLEIGALRKSLATLSDAVAAADLIVGTFDRFSTRAVLQIASLLTQRPFAVAALEPRRGQVTIYEEPTATGCYCCGLPDPRLGRWHDGGSCTLAPLDIQRIVGSLASELITQWLTVGGSEYNEIAFNSGRLTIDKIRRGPSRGCSLCGANGVLADSRGDAAQAVLTWLFGAEKSGEMSGDTRYLPPG